MSNIKYHIVSLLTGVPFAAVLSENGRMLTYA